MVVTGSEQTSLHSYFRVNGRWGSKTKLGEIEHRFILFGSEKSNKVIEDLGYAERGQRDVLSRLDELLNERSGWLIFQQSEDGEGVEDNHRLRSRAASSILDRCRIWSLLKVPRRYFPLSAPTGSAVRGRSTTRSPRSTTTTRSAFHRALASAGIDTCPFEETLIT